MIADIHAWSLFKSSSISRCYMPHYIAPEEVIAVLNAAKVQFTLAGAHGIGGWTGKPRATEDVDVIVAKRHLKRAVTALLAAFPHLEAVDLPVVIRLREKGTETVAIDIMKPVQPIIHAALKNTTAAAGPGGPYKVPSLEMALALKFAPMVSLNRQEDDKLQDVVDFSRVVRAHPEVDLAKLEELGDLVYPSGGREILEIVRRVRAGERLSL